MDTLRLGTSTMRRNFALCVLWALALMLIYVAMAHPPALGWQLFLVVFAGLVAWQALRFQRATAQVIVWDGTTLREEGGAVLTTFDNIRSVDRGAFAFKPSHGFLVTTHQPEGRYWAPGLWWRMGRLIGVGGVTPAPQAKMMAEAIALAVAQRDAAADADAE